MNKELQEGEFVTKGQASLLLSNSPLAAPQQQVGIAHSDLAIRQSVSQLPPKARFTHANKRNLFSEHPDNEAWTYQELPLGVSFAPGLAPDLAVSGAPSAVSAAAAAPFPVITASKQPPSTSAAGSPSKSAERQLPRKHPINLGCDLGHIPNTSLGAFTASGNPQADSDQADSDSESESNGPDPDPLHRGNKALRLSISKIQGHAEPRKPRIGPQFQAFVPPWPPGL